MLEDIKSLLDIEDTSKDAKLNILINRTKQAVMNYCNRDDFPKELESIVVDYIVDESLNQTKVANQGSVSFKYQVSEADLRKYEDQLARFRKVRVV